MGGDMCGILAGIKFSDKLRIRNLFLLSQERGSDATGVAYVKDNQL